MSEQLFHISNTSQLESAIPALNAFGKPSAPHMARDLVARAEPDYPVELTSLVIVGQQVERH